MKMIILCRQRRFSLPQCRKPELMLGGMRRAHAELVESKFMVRLTELDQKIQDAIRLHSVMLII